MPSFKKRHDAKKKKETLGMLKNFSDKIKNGELEVEVAGWWPGVAGSYTLRVTVKESENSRILDEN